MDIVEKARIFATEAHAGQKRKYTGEDYIVHPAEVVKALKYVMIFKPEILAAGWLHDTVEDCDITIEQIGCEFGVEVMTLVFWMTDPEIEGNRATRKAFIRERWCLAPNEAKTIKLADMISNSGSIFERDPGFAKVYGPEMVALLPCLKGGDSVLYQVAEQQLKVKMGELAHG